jgi:hypothetical protein
MEFAATPTVEHVATSPEERDGKFHGKCRCGWEATAAATPSTAFQRSTDHVNRVTEVKTALVKLNQDGESLAGPDEAAPARYRRPAKKVAAPRQPKREPVKTKCGCGCGGEATQRTEIKLVFLPGHDARAVSNFVSDVQKNRITAEAALAVFAERPKLQAKLAKRLGVTLPTE